MGGLRELPPRCSGVAFEPLRPKDPTWHGRRGDLNSELGPVFPLVELRYPDGSSAVQRQDDGSGFAIYPSGHKAVCVLCHHRSRRVSAIVYASSEFTVRSAVPAASRPGREAVQQKPTRTRHLGAIDDWGVGILESTPDGAGARASYEVSATHVTIQAMNGTRTRASKASLAMEAEKPMQLRLSPELVVSYDPARGTTVLYFSADGVQHTFLIGEVWRSSQGRGKLGQATATSAAGIFDAISLRGQASLEASSLVMLDATATLDKTMRCSMSSCLLPGTGGSPMGGTHTSLLSKSASESTMRFNAEATRSLCEGRIDFTFEGKLRKKLAKDVHPPLPRAQPAKAVREGYLWPSRHPGPPPGEPPQTCQPVSLEPVPCAKVAELVASLESKPVLLVVLAVATWAVKSSYSSSAHARVIAEAALAELTANGDGDRVKFCVAELSEAGAIYSETKYANPLVKQYGVKQAPWLLMFSKGDLVLSENPQSQEGGGIGFASRLRYMAVAKPRVLMLEPAPSSTAAQATAAACAAESAGRTKNTKTAINNFKLQMEAQEVLKRSGFQFDLAMSQGDAMRMAASAEPPYGILLCSSEAGAGQFSEVFSRVRERSPEAISFIGHDVKSLGPLDGPML
ncbi:unnamed protein product, partial [Polarella glacialis]